MRLLVLALCLLLTGCSALLTPTTDTRKTFHAALTQLAEQNNPGPMQALANGSDPLLADDAQTVLRLHAEAAAGKGGTPKQLAALREENRQLKEKLDELSRLHLDLDRRTR